MLTKNIYLIRHGETDFNKNGVVQGSGVNSSLNTTGKRQAEAFFEKYKQVSFDKIYISALKRTRQSVEHFIKRGIPYESLDGLNEINWGNREGQPFTKEENLYYYSILEKWKQGHDDHKIEGGESPLDVQKRLRIAVDHILKNDDEHNILICMHGRAMRILLSTLLNYPLKCMDQFEHSNLCLYILQYTGSAFRIDTFNDTSHLDGKFRS